MAENKLYSLDFGVKSWIFFIIVISIVYAKIKLCTKFDAKMLIRSKVMVDWKKNGEFFYDRYNSETFDRIETFFF